MNALIVVLILTVFFYTLSILRKRRRLPYPPGPAPWPIVGNALEMPLERPWLKYGEWCKTYGEHLKLVNLRMSPEPLP